MLKHYKVYFILQPNMTTDADYDSDLDIVAFHESIKQAGYLMAVVRGTSLLIPYHAITGILEGTL